QKLLSRSRSLEITRLLCTKLEKWARTAPLNKKHRSKFIRHCRITIAFQCMMTAVRAQTKSLQIWNLRFPDFAIILIGSLEAINLVLGRRLADHIVSSKDANLLNSISANNSSFRTILDSALLVLNEARKRCSALSDLTTGNPEAFVRALQLAHETCDIMLVWDHY